nr:hypothetical protein [Mycobacterium kubicae]
MGRVSDRPDQNGVNRTCPLQCRLRQGAGSSTAAGRVDWAGLPVNLDMAFSREQRDKVYAQHEKRRRGALLRRLLGNGTPDCVCELTARAPAADQENISASSSGS